MKKRLQTQKWLAVTLLLTAISQTVFSQLAKEDLKLSEQGLFEKFESQMKKLGKWDSLTANEKKFRFEIFKKNLKVINKVVPPPKDKFGRPLLGLTAAIYRKGINKFAFLTDEEFQSSFLMKKEVLYVENKFQSQALENRLSFDNFLQTNSDSGQILGNSQDEIQNGGRGVGGVNDSLPGLEDEIARFNDATEVLEEDLEDVLSIFDETEMALANSGQNSINSAQNQITNRNQSSSQLQELPRPSQNRFKISNLQGRILQQSIVPGLKNSIDWTHLFNPVFDQLDCNSCYAAAAVGAIEAMHKKVYPDSPKIKLSKQEILDCSKENFHCLGGQPSSVMGYVKEYGVSYASSYPYKGKKQFCQARYLDNTMRKRSAARILESLMASATEGDWQGSRPRILQQQRFGQYQYSNFSSNPNRQRFGQTTQQVPFRSGFPQQNNQFQRQSNQFNQFNQFRQNTVPQRSGFPQQRSGFPNQTVPQRSGFPNNNNQRSGFSHNHSHQVQQNQFNRGFNSFPVQQRKPQREVQYDQIRRTYFMKVTSFVGNTPQVSYQDLQGRPYTPSFVQPRFNLPHVHLPAGQNNRNGSNSNNSGNNQNQNNSNSSKKNEKENELEELKDDDGLSVLPTKEITKPGEDPKDPELIEISEIDQKKKAEEEAKQKEKEEAEQKAKEEADRLKKEKEEADRIAKEEADRKAKEEAERKAKEEAERKAKEEAERLALEEAERQRKAEELAEQQRQIKLQEEIQRQKAEAEAQRKAKEQADRKAKEQANLNKKQFTITGPRYEELKGYYFIRKNVMDVLKALQYGPVVTAHFVSEAFKFYESGVFDGDGCENGSLDYVNHASVIVGYDLEAPVPYFKMRNSWADDWGEKGYYRMKIGELSKENTGICLIAGTPFMVFPYLEKRG